jgi:acetyl/propionyl-CoA carboxylase alpha subunit
MDFEFTVNGTLQTISLERKDDRICVRHGDKVLEAEVRVISANAISVLVGGRSFLILVARDKDRRYIWLDGRTYLIQSRKEDQRLAERGDDRTQKGKSVVTAPMPGKVVKINVAEKEAVRKNQTLAIVEAMKMENEIKSPLEGFVKKIYVSAGDLVDSEKPLLELEPKI